jgi:hypothetical protein
MVGLLTMDPQLRSTVCFHAVGQRLWSAVWVHSAGPWFISECESMVWLHCVRVCSIWVHSLIQSLDTRLGSKNGLTGRLVRKSKLMKFQVQKLGACVGVDSVSTGLLAGQVYQLVVTSVCSPCALAFATRPLTFTPPLA